MKEKGLRKDSTVISSEILKEGENAAEGSVAGNVKEEDVPKTPVLKVDTFTTSPD